MSAGKDYLPGPRDKKAVPSKEVNTSDCPRILGADRGSRVTRMTRYSVHRTGGGVHRRTFSLGHPYSLNSKENIVFFRSLNVNEREGNRHLQVPTNTGAASGIVSHQVPRRWLCPLPGW